MNHNEKVLVRNAAIVIGVSFLLSRVMLGNFLFTILLMVLAPKFSDRRKALLPVGAVAVLMFAFELVQARSALSDPAGRLLLLIGMFIPVVLLIGSAIWIYLDDQRTLIRYLASTSFGVVASMLLVVMLSRGSETVLRVDAAMLETFQLMFQQLEGSAEASLDLQKLYRMSVLVSGSMLVPTIMGLIGFASFMAMSYNARLDGTFSDRIARWKAPEINLWVFLGAWTVVLLMMILKASYIVRALALNIALGSSVLFAVQGIAIVLYIVRRKGLAISTGRLLSTIFFIAMVVPGLNVLVVFVLPLLGVTETWIVYRKNE
ncbi:MAG: DUF115 domain-containing protein [Spirochaetia bacterium]|nr:DUF115 domain-containing protein [Spirochaetia bacterium]